MYDGDIRTDSDGIYIRPSFYSENDLFEIHAECVDSSGYDTLSGEQSEIGEFIKAIGNITSSDHVQATTMSSILAEGFKSSGNLSADNYNSQKDNLESALGIDDIDENVYNDNTDSDRAVANSAAILKLESLMDGLESVLSSNSNMSSKELRIEMKSSLFSKISEVDYDSSGC